MRIPKHLIAALLAITPFLSPLWLENPIERALVVFVCAVILWFTELIPLAVTALLIPIWAIANGLLSTKDAFASFGSEILFLFLGSFLLARAMQKHGWDKRMSYWLLSSRFSMSGIHGATLSISGLAWTLSMWISNTAAAAIIIPMAIGIQSSLSEHLGDEDSRNLNTRLILAAAFAASLGGLATPIGSPPNLLAIQFLSNHGITIGFMDWMKIGFPLALTALVFLNFLLAWRYPVKNKNISVSRPVFKMKLQELGPVKKAELQVAATFTLAVFFWVAPSLLEMLNQKEMAQILANKFPMGAVALLSALILFFLPIDKKQFNLTWEDSHFIDWGTIMIFGGGLCLGTILDQSGLATQLAHFLFGQNATTGILSIIVLIVVSIVLSEFSSNTAAASILIPIVLAGSSNHTQALAATMACAFATSFGLMLPISTPPNAIAYGTGQVSLRSMIRTGLFLDFLGLGLSFLAAQAIVSIISSQ
jgi:sodium-dependent dicarboxylate transporter 2/3/5